ncbi:malto-oligosyltrehalose trehalohydrolase [Mucilaginibacter pallidiroseus]|uniref:Malto-oligosyltrehalose trehalohydrolase n=1 Tax=Mucilaginibacter pallidiroseus TaxID=2599295 RepID=A0A563UJP8_9SPHI|nr:malto-oligosyltrehalose trehalohydrolase [Mucilaginibacter pallidiroseus]TWR31529.1 malto-oligosyltrehalose trehalohydrolase [Mucilaginibacter pallidiroseus]
MDNSYKNKLVPGVTFSQNGEAQIVLWAPKAEDVSIKIDEEGGISLNKADKGYWTLNTSKLKPLDKYKFILNGTDELPDPASRSQPDGVHGPSQAIDLAAYRKEAADWNNLPLTDYIIYELHTGTFTPDGTFADIENKLPYLKELGITAIEIMPVAQFPGERNWGYDGVFPYAVQNSYGGPEALFNLVNACHQHGLAVILDVVYNHVGPEGNYFNEFGPYFTQKYNTPWGNAVNFDDAGCDEVRNYFVQNVLMWFRDFGIDALRLDAVHAIKDFSPKHILQEMREAVDELMSKTGKTHYLIIEFDLNDKRFIDPIDNHGFGMHAQWIDEFHHALRVTVGGDRNGYYSDFNGLQHLAKAYKDAYVYDGVYSPKRQKTFGTKTNNPGWQFVAFSQNHDHVGNRMLGERSSTLFSFEMQKLMAAAVMVSPYLPMLFMGEEYSEQKPFLYFVSHTDKELIEAVRKGRKDEFKAFHSEGEAPDPQAEDTFEQSKLNWDSLNGIHHQTMLGYYKQLIQLRKSIPALHGYNRENLAVEFDESAQTLRLYRWEGQNQVYCYMNFSDEAQSFVPPEGNFTIALNSSSTNSQSENQLQPQSVIIYTN